MRKRLFAAIPGLLGWLSAHWESLTVVLVFALLLVSARAQTPQDIQVIGGTNPYIIIGRGIAWSGSGPGNLNNNFIFSPVDPNQGFCLFLSNNNPSSSHNVTVAVAQTGDPALKFFQGFAQKWFTVPTVTAFPVTVPALGIVGINYKTTASAGITVSFSGAILQAGSPDTVDVFAVQTNQSACGSLSSNSVQGVAQQGTTEVLTNQFPVQIGGLVAPGSSTTVQTFTVGTQGNGFLQDARAFGASTVGNGFQAVGNYGTPQVSKGPGIQVESIQSVIPISTFGSKNAVKFLGGYAKSNFLEMASDMASITGGSMPGWGIFGKVTNPGAGGLIVGDVLSTTATVNVAYKSAVLNCSAACELQIFPISSAGSACTAVTPQNLNVFGGARLGFGSGHTAIQGTCTTNPTTNGAALYDLFLAAGTSYTIDLTGWIDENNSGTTEGLAVFNVTALTGTASATFTLAEE